MSELTFGPQEGGLVVRTRAAGRAGGLGHSLTISFDRWHARVLFEGDRPVEAELAADVDSFRVAGAKGGVTRLSPVDRIAIRRSALATLSATEHPSIRFAASQFEPLPEGYAVRGELRIAAGSRPLEARVDVEDSGGGWRIHAELSLKQTDYGIKPYSAMFGALRVRDEVVVEFDATVPADAPVPATLIRG